MSEFSKKVLCACEFTQAFTMALRSLGVDAYSCDIQPAEQDSRVHYQCDLRDLLDIDWLAIIAFPPCTYLTYAGAHLMRVPERKPKIFDALRFVSDIWSSRALRVAIENPLGIISNAKLQKELFGDLVFYRPYNQLLSWNQFGDDRKKRTCLWMRGLPLVLPLQAGTPGRTWISSSHHLNNNRVRMSPVFAHAVACNWSPFLSA